MRVQFLSQYFWPEETATAEMLSGIAFALAARGIEVRAIAGQPAYRRPTRLPPRLSERGVTVRRVASTRMDKNRSVGRVLNTATFALSAFGAVVLGPRRSLLLPVTNPPLLPWVARAGRAIRRVAYVVVVHDVYPQIAVALGSVGRGSAIDRLWRALNRWAYRGAERIIALGECMADVLRGELPPGQQSKVVVIPNWADGQAIRPLPRKEHSLLAEWGCAGRFVVQYSGNIGLFHEIETIIEAAERLREEAVQFVFIGDGGQRPWLERTVEERQLGNVTLLPFQPKDRLPLTLTACDVGLVTLKEEATGFCVPSKFYGILAAGKPALAIMNERCEIARAAQRHACGIVVKPGDGGGLAGEILRLRSDPNRLKTMGLAARRAFEENYTADSIAGRYAEMLEGLLG